MKSVFILAIILLSFFQIQAQVEYGFSVDYLKDINIQSDSRVVFARNFEEASVTELMARWEYRNQSQNWHISPDLPQHTGGRQSAAVYGGWADLYQRFTTNSNILYVRYYTKLDTSCVGVHHWPWIGGHNPSTAFPWPRAGDKPVGNERFSTGIEPMGTNWRWDFYSYFMDMGICPDNKYWGNQYTMGDSIPAVRGKWVCIEFMVKLNTPGQSDGEQAFWIDGVKKFHLRPGSPVGRWVNGCAWSSGCRQCENFPGMRWRSTTDLKFNYFWLEHFVDTDLGCEGWFDDLVIATDYIGPMVSQKPPAIQSVPGSGSSPVIRMQTPSGARVVFQIPSVIREDWELKIFDGSGSVSGSMTGTRRTNGQQTVEWNQKLVNGHYYAVFKQGKNRLFGKFLVMR